MLAISDMAREVGWLRAIRQNVEIKTGSLDGLLNAINRVVGLNSSEAKGVAKFSFMGVNIVESPILPRNTAVILSDGQVINIIKF